jgi:putative membrane protein
MLKQIWLTVFFVVLVWSGVDPHDYFTWFLEVSPAVIGLIVLAVTRQTFPLTGLTYGLILIHCIILMVGGHYTYAEVPFFDTFGGLLDPGRNNYDKLGHLAQGFVPAIIAREILIRKAIVNGNGWRNVIIVSICLAFSALYELIEWCVALLVGISAESFLGTQGYVWDTQSDMLMALLGAVAALVSLGGIHDRQLEKLRPESGNRAPGG